MAFTFLVGLFDSREKKLHARRNKLTGKLNQVIEKEEQRTLDQIDVFFTKTLFDVERAASSRLKLLGKSMLSLSNGERELALGHSNNHRDITRKIVENILEYLNLPKTELDRVKYAVRIPGRRLVLVVDGNGKLQVRPAELTSALGSREIINIIYLDFNRPRNAQILFLFRYFGFKSPLIKTLNDGKQTIVYIINDNFNDEQYDSLDLIQQIMNIHIIVR